MFYAYKNYDTTQLVQMMQRGEVACSTAATHCESYNIPQLHQPYAGKMKIVDQHFIRVLIYFYFEW